MLEKIKSFFAMGEYCVNSGSTYTVCREYFWQAGSYAAIGIFALGTAAFAYRRWRLVVMRRESKRLMREHLENEQRVADELTMQRFKWKGDAAVPTGREHGDLATEIREALQTRKLNG